MPRLKVYECGICGCWHPQHWNGDCREDLYRLPDPENLMPTALRRWRDVDSYPQREGARGDVFAVMFDGGFHAPGCDVTCYQHVGQHSEGTWSVILSRTVPVDPSLGGEGRYDDVRALVKELRDIGYNPLIVTRRPKVEGLIQPDIVSIPGATTTCADCGDDFPDGNMTPRPNGDGEYCPTCVRKHRDEFPE